MSENQFTTILHPSSIGEVFINEYIKLAGAEELKKMVNNPQELAIIIGWVYSFAVLQQTKEDKAYLETAAKAMENYEDTIAYLKSQVDYHAQMHESVSKTLNLYAQTKYVQVDDQIEITESFGNIALFPTHPQYNSK